MTKEPSTVFGSLDTFINEHMRLNAFSTSEDGWILLFARQAIERAAGNIQV